MNLNLLPYNFYWEDLEEGMTLITESQTLKEHSSSFRQVQQFFYSQLLGGNGRTQNVFLPPEDLSAWLLGSALGLLASHGEAGKVKIASIQSVVFNRSIQENDAIRLRLECLGKSERDKQRWEHPSGMATWKVDLMDEEDSSCLETQVSTIVVRKHPFTEIDRNNLEMLLEKLTESTQPKWGYMTSQHLVEHFEYFYQMALGNIPGKILIPEEVIPKYQNSLWNYKPLPQQFQHPMLKKGEPEELRFGSLAEAKAAFWKSFDAVEDYFRKNPDGRLMVAMFGMLDRYHWYLQNRKHFTYHFEQFGII